jgi:hypothetical protein
VSEAVTDIAQEGALGVVHRMRHEGFAGAHPTTFLKRGADAGPETADKPFSCVGRLGRRLSLRVPPGVTHVAIFAD